MTSSSPPAPRGPNWYAVRCLFQVDGRDARRSPEGERVSAKRRYFYEERITLWQAPSFESAYDHAEADAEAYAADIASMIYTGLAQAYWMFDPPAHGAEVFSLIRESKLKRKRYLRRFFTTGREIEKASE